MTITYYSSRREVADWYWFMWRRSTTLKLRQLCIAAGVFMTAWLFQIRATVSPMARGLVATAVTLVALAFLPLYPLLMFKPQERRLTIEEEGVSTSIGALHGKVPSREVAEIVSRGDTLYIVRNNLNAFVIPLRAFATDDQRDAFQKAAKGWLHRAHAQSAV